MSFLLFCFGSVFLSFGNSFMFFSLFFFRQGKEDGVTPSFMAVQSGKTQV